MKSLKWLSFPLFVCNYNNILDFILKCVYWLYILLQELIQNADDAKATVVKLVLDHRNQATLPEHLVGTSYQGPALLAYNNAAFSDEDWEGIQSLQQSGKAKDPFKVGKFGIGFNSVYHITGTLWNQ